ncbi:MAG: hypothetical protein R3F08_09680 [Dokdonella sp.]|nr:hypothetical protein [Dokdonella sp.]MCB1570891.1 hypothetical protein [Xanthomonadales bacterium]MCB1572744.1 hypothetical protein [Xanthomonadales bacterium]MCB1578707.1 hypothetical protein [Xanthomonadales bacterium]
MRTWTIAAASVVGFSIGAANAGTPLSTRIYVAELQTEQLYRVAIDWDGQGTLTASEPELVATAGAGGGIVVSEFLVYVTGSGVVSRIDLRTGQVSLAQTFNNANVCAPDLSGSLLYCGWSSTLHGVPLQPFGNGTPVALTGGDLNLTDIVFTPSGESFYSTGTESIIGHFGRIDFDVGQTTRLQTSAFATGLGWDPYTQRILVAGFGRVRMVDPAAPTVIDSQRDDSASENYLSLNADGSGHAIGTRCCVSDARVVLLDYSETGNLADAQTLIASVALPGLQFISGEAMFEDDRIFHSEFEESEP